jgi:hypothetical protein
MRKILGRSVVFCLGLCLSSTLVRADDAEDKAIEALRKLGAKVGVASELPDSRWDVSFTGTKVSDADLPPLKSLKLYALSPHGTQVRTLQALEGSTSLRYLELRDTQVGDAGLARLKGMTRLENLMLGGTQVTDKGLAHLGG